MPKARPLLKYGRLKRVQATDFSKVLLGGFIVFDAVVEIYRTAADVQHIRVVHDDVGRQASQIAEVREQVQKEQESTKLHPAKTRANEKKILTSLS